MECCTQKQCIGFNVGNFLTREEKIEMLKEYKEVLDKESIGVSEKIRELEE